MKKIYYKPILLFLLSCFLIIPAFALFSSIFVMIMSIIGMLGTKYGSHFPLQYILFTNLVRISIVFGLFFDFILLRDDMASRKNKKSMA